MGYVISDVSVRSASEINLSIDCNLIFQRLFSMFHVVEFVESKEVEVVHRNWLKGDQSFWPPFQSISKLRKAVKDGVHPGADWTPFKIRILYSHDVYETACEKVAIAQVTSDLNTDTEEDKRPGYLRRKNRGCKRRSSSSEEEEEEGQGRAAPVAHSTPKTYIQLEPAPCIPSLSALDKDLFLHPQSSPEGPWASPPHGCQTGIQGQRSYMPAGELVSSALDKDLLHPHMSTTSSAWAPTNGCQNGLVHKSIPAQEAVPSALAREILIELKSIKEQQLLILLQLQKQSTSPSSNQVVPDPLPFELPLAEVKHLERLEETLKNPEMKKNLTTLLGLVGGLSLKDTVARILKKTMNTSLARMINWSGANGKPAFKRTNLKCVVLDAVRCNALTQDATDKEIEVTIARWLQLASDRDGGRSQRRKDQNQIEKQQ
ncbi:hypothetical protein ACEWY4_025609 [Coilia grayii]|uniref:DUF4806 domain-containing protein n=2 Tax=Coilia grayii TaxID=363190 RepID=A0ABD1ISE4_9TELE